MLDKVTLLLFIKCDKQLQTLHFLQNELFHYFIEYCLSYTFRRDFAMAIFSFHYIWF